MRRSAKLHVARPVSKQDDHYPADLEIVKPVLGYRDALGLGVHNGGACSGMVNSPFGEP